MEKINEKKKNQFVWVMGDMLNNYDFDNFPTELVKDAEKITEYMSKTDAPYETRLISALIIYFNEKSKKEDLK